MSLPDIRDFYDRSQFETLRAKVVRHRGLEYLFELVFGQLPRTYDASELGYGDKYRAPRPLDEERLAKLSEVLQPLNPRERDVALASLGLRTHRPQSQDELAPEMRISRRTFQDTQIEAIRKLHVAQNRPKLPPSGVLYLDLLP